MLFATIEIYPPFLSYRYILQQLDKMYNFEAFKEVKIKKMSVQACNFLDRGLDLFEKGMVNPSILQILPMWYKLLCRCGYVQVENMKLLVYSEQMGQKMEKHIMSLDNLKLGETEVILSHHI